MDTRPEQLSVRVSGDELGVSPGGESCVQHVAAVCGLAAVSHTEGAKTCSIYGFADTKQQLVVACLLYWKLQVAEESSALVSVRDPVTGTYCPLFELLNCGGTALEAGAVRVIDAAAFVKEVLQQETDEKVQILDCREQRAFLGLDSGKEVSGHLKGANNVPFACIFTAQSDRAEEKENATGCTGEKSEERLLLLPADELRNVFMTNGIDVENPVVVVASVPAEAAAVATALLIAGQSAWIAFCDDALTDDLVASFPASYTSDIFHEGRLLYKDAKGEFDLSSQQNDACTTKDIDTTAVAELEKAYTEKLSEKTGKEREGAAGEEEEEKVADVVWIQDGHRFFDMPHPVSRNEFLDASRTIFRVASFVLAPFGFPASLRRKRSLQEVKTQCGSLFQDVVEVCSDLVYQQKEINEGSMAMSVHKWVEKKHDSECSEQLKAINELWDVLYTPPTVVEIPDVSEEHVLNLATRLGQKMRDVVGQRTPWVCDSVDEGEEGESSDEEDLKPRGNVRGVNSLDEEELNEEEIDELCKDSEAYSEDDTASEDTDKQERVAEEGADGANKTETVTEEEGAVPGRELASKEGEHSADDDTVIAQHVTDDHILVEIEDLPAGEDDVGVNGVDIPDSGADDSETAKSLSGGEQSGPIEHRLAESWKHMYPSVVYSLGFIPRNVDTSHKKLSTLQIKSLIQAIAEASWDVIKDEIEGLSQIEFQALCETLNSDKREQLTDRVAKAEKSLYVLKHFLTRPLKSDDSLADKLAGVREAVLGGDIRRRSGNYQAALEAYSKAFTYLPLYHKELENAVVGRARSFLDMKAWACAKTQAQIALRLNPYSVSAYECLGIAEEETGHIEAAMQHYVTSFILDGSRSPELAESIDRVSRLVGRRVAKDLFAGMEKVHNLPSPWLVNSYFESFEHDVDHAARIPFDIGKKEDVEQADLDGRTLLHRAIHLKRCQQFTLVQRDICALVSRDMEAEGLSVEERATALNLHASLLYVAGDVHTALEAIDQSLELQPTLVNSLVKKGGFLAELGEVGEATLCFTKAMDLDANEADVHLHYGQMKLLDGNYKEAVQYLRRCISRSDALPVTYVSYGMALYKSGSTYQAKDLFKEASDKFPASAEVHLFYGEVLADQGNYADAMRHFLTAWELSPQCPLPFLNAGRVYVSTNDPLRAIAHFQQALRVDPRCSSAHLDIAQVLFAQGRTREAFEHFDTAAACCRFLPEVEEVCACQEMAKMQLKVTDILGVELRHIMRAK